MAKKPHFTNRLIHQKSPYLLQHAHNPVDWYPWGDLAFEKSKELDKPIFLSSGYATCHWCHVMENESFQNLEVASLLNDSFINIKVDREELPEVDSLYMDFAQSMMAGSAGWPLNIILTPDLEPFFAATYIPPESKQGMMGMVDLVERINELWYSEEREKVVEQAGRIVQAFTDNVHTSGSEIPSPDAPQIMAELLYKLADPVYGGLQGSPKFPIGYQYIFLLRHSFFTKDTRAVFLVERTLDMMQRGGIYDHLGGGFSRYSVDAEWLQPHFEKMLYDNALIAQAYLEAWNITKKPFYQEIFKEIIHYLERDMKHPLGGFYSAEDADSEGHEGYFYTWEKKEILKHLGEEGELFCDFYNVEEEGPFVGRNILHIREREEAFAQQHGVDVEELKNKLQRQKDILWDARELRPHPFKDDKILSSWNGLIIHTLAEAGIILMDEAYLQSAKNAALFIKNNMWKDGKLARRFREGDILPNGSLDDYAFMIRALLTLFEADMGYEFFEWAIKLNSVLTEKFKTDQGAYFQTDGENSGLIIRKCQFSDGAEPSGNSVQCENLIRLYQFTFDQTYLSDAEDIFKAVKKYIDNYAPGYGYHIMNLNRYFDKNKPTMVVSLNEKNDNLDIIKSYISESYSPHRAVIFKRRDIPLFPDYKPKDGKTTLYVCQDGVCQEPLTDIKDIEAAILKH